MGMVFAQCELSIAMEYIYTLLFNAVPERYTI